MAKQIYGEVTYSMECGNEKSFIIEYIDRHFGEFWNSKKLKEKDDGCTYELIWEEKISEDKYNAMPNKKKFIAG